MKKVFALMAVAAFATACIGTGNKPAETTETEVIEVVTPETECTAECTCAEGCTCCSEDGTCTCAEGECKCECKKGEAAAEAAPAETPVQ